MKTKIRIIEVKIFIAFLIGIIAVSSCKEMNNKDNKELTISKDQELESFILKKYFEYDYKLFERVENCYFENFIGKELASFDKFYNTIYKGIKIKYYNCPYNNYSFSLIESSDGKFYYSSLFEFNYCHGFINKSYTREGTELKATNAALTLLDLPAATFNEVFRNEKLFKISKNKINDPQYMTRKLTLGMGFIYLCKVMPNNIAYQPFLAEKVKFGDLEKELQVLTGGRELSKSEKELVFKPLENAYNSIGKSELFVYKVNNSGLLVFIVKYSKDKGHLILEEKFIPQMVKKVVFKWDINYNGTYPQCE
jgi:hypothetical protein